MHTLDSRVIRLGNCFAHRFSERGTFSYALSPLPSSFAAHEDEPPARSVTVVDSDAAPARHYVVVSVVDGELHALPAHLEVHAGDMVVWSPDRSVTFGFRVRGVIGDHPIDSAALHRESLFTHAFALPGTYRWVDANGSGLGGRVQVRSPETASGTDAWLARLQEGTLVHVRGERAEPEHVDIVVGQTVVWAIDDAPGVTITDVDLLHVGRP